ncbi:sensor histidine kinase [Desulfogranum mediterraneum]|uniref:sensor histidine kinase n=1 Tax=Desulfogranum mediterraneum TaxID=160661 RepID=UPI00054D464B|nr:ATP-binding protein [Desulfogranum mediterraneum]
MMKNRLLWKLLLTNIVPVIVVIIGIIWLAIDKLAAVYFMHLMDNYAISPHEIHSMFLSSIHHYLLWASLVALIVAALLSYLLTRRVLRPLSQMSRITVNFAAGDFSSRVRVSTADEVGELGHSFNRMADSLEQLDQLRKNMVADVAHELRTPLTNLCGYLEAINDQVLPPSAETMAMLHQESLQLMQLVDDLQQLARADAARAMLRRTRVLPAEELGEMLKLYQHKFRDKDIRVVSCLSSTTPLLIDRDKLLQAMRNLFENCWKYTPAGGEIRLEVVDREDQVRVSFTNSGPGIPREDLPFIFERFFRTDRSRSRDGGFGLGLAISKRLIEAQGGRVGADSDGQQTTVWFSLPVD